MKFATPLTFSRFALSRLKMVFIALAFCSSPLVAADVAEGIPPNGKRTAELQSFIKNSCLDCHDADSQTGLDLSSMGHALTSAKTFRTWVRIFDRIERGEMPPAAAEQPNEADKQEAMSILNQNLTHANKTMQRETGRVPSRRLTRIEYEHTLHDLLGIGGDLAKYLPPENTSGAFDVIAANQGMSTVHVRGFLKAADLALDEAIQLGARPNMKPREIDYFNSKYFQMWVDRAVRRGGGTVFKTDQDVVTFRGENFVLRSDVNGFRPPVAGRYHITVKAAAYQARSSITVSLKRQNDKQGESELFAAWDLVGEDYRDVSTTKYLRPDDYIYVSADELEPAPDGAVIYNSQPASTFGGEGVKIRRVTVQGPLEDSWPPERTQDLFAGIEWASSKRNRWRGRFYKPTLTKAPIEHLRDIVTAFAARAFRRKVTDAEVETFVELASPSLKAGGDFVDSVRIPLRAILVSPELLFQTGKAGALDDAALAGRLSYFVWRTVPDDELMNLAAEGRLSDPETLTAQVDRLLANAKSNRFVNDFLDQWLELDRIDATTPDASLYPEYDDVLRRAMLAETREFFRHLIDENLSIENLIDSDFTFLNRKLAEHYGIEGLEAVEGEVMRKVQLPPGSVRGGILAHASIAKVTANGTVTTPVKRGNFVLTNLLGLSPNPPPPGVGAIEPDTRGATTIRETLAKHQSVESCAVCHRQIDPPGFAMECFDPVGLFRDRYRNSKRVGVKNTAAVGLRFLHKDYRPGLPVDASGVTADGHPFRSIREYKTHLRQSKQQVARNIVSQLVAFSTGAEIQFADRAVVEEILQATKDDGYPLRSLIHHVVASHLFRSR